MKETYHLKSLIHQLTFNYTYAIDLVDDIEESLMTHTPAKGLENHPSFTIGHIITAYGLTIKYLGGDYTINKKWDNLFRRNGPGDPRFPAKDKKLYPTKSELLKELNVQHEKLLSHLSTISREKLDENIDWRFSHYFPRTIDLIYFMSITHYAMHINQLAAWRRAMDLPSSLSRL